MAYEPHAAPTETARSDLAARLKERIDKTAARLKDVPEAELDELIDGPSTTFAIIARESAESAFGSSIFIVEAASPSHNGKA